MRVTILLIVPIQNVKVVVKSHTKTILKKGSPAAGIFHNVLVYTAY